MNDIHIVFCPNCGGYATRSYCLSQQTLNTHCSNQKKVVTTECPICDYLITMCYSSGQVIETSSSQFVVSVNKRKSSQTPTVALSRPTST